MPKYKIILQDMLDTNNNIVFQLKNIENEDVILKTALQIFLDKNILYNLSPEEISCVSYTAGYEVS